MITPSQPGEPVIRWFEVDAKNFGSIGYSTATRKLFIKFNDSATLCFEKVPGFRFEGLKAAARKDAYYETYIKERFLMKKVG
ncbi:MAG: KTSC domain-containing protein [Verrucomicrobiota bacterium]